MKKTFWIINLVMLAAMAVGNYFYHTTSGMNMKTICSVGFAVFGTINLIFTFLYNRKKLNFAALMTVGLILAMLGDITIHDNFIGGAALFAGGHVCYFFGQCVLMGWQKRDLIPSAVLLIGAGSFLLLCPLLDFGNQVNQIVCLVYALIISMMTGKAISNFLRERNAVTAVLLCGCVLFFFSDLMLVFNWFMDTGRITAILCMATYYPAESLLAHAIFRHAARSE